MEFKASVWNFGELTGDSPEKEKDQSLSVIDSVDMLSAISLPRRNHEILLIVTICGSVEIDVDGRHIVMSPKTLMVLLPGHFIEGYHTSDSFRGFMLTASVGKFASALPLLSRLLVCSLYFKNDSIVELTDGELANQILLRDLLRRKINQSTGVYDSIVVDKLCEVIFYETMNIYFNRIDGEFSTRCKRSELLFYNFVVNVEKNFMSERSVAFYADRLCVTSKHLSSVVKEISGRTAGDWIDSYVVNEIKRLLATTEMTIQEISCKMNFANQSFFGKYFKNNTGMSPREYRNRSLSENQRAS